ncbi:hypothetical protein LPJ61_006947, partial [Coemansia biformis]
PVSERVPDGDPVRAAAAHVACGSQRRHPREHEAVGQQRGGAERGRRGSGDGPAAAHRVSRDRRSGAAHKGPGAAGAAAAERAVRRRIRSGVQPAAGDAWDRVDAGAGAAAMRIHRPAAGAVGRRARRSVGPRRPRRGRAQDRRVPALRPGPVPGVVWRCRRGAAGPGRPRARDGCPRTPDRAQPHRRRRRSAALAAVRPLRLPAAVAAHRRRSGLCGAAGWRRCPAAAGRLLRLPRRRSVGCLPSYRPCRRTPPRARHYQRAGAAAPACRRCARARGQGVSPLHWRDGAGHPAGCTAGAPPGLGQRPHRRGHAGARDEARQEGQEGGRQP